MTEKEREDLEVMMILANKVKTQIERAESHIDNIAINMAAAELEELKAVTEHLIKLCKEHN